MAVAVLLDSGFGITTISEKVCVRSHVNQARTIDQSDHSLKMLVVSCAHRHSTSRATFTSRSSLKLGPGRAWPYGGLRIVGMLALHLFPNTCKEGCMARRVIQTTSWHGIALCIHGVPCSHLFTHFALLHTTIHTLLPFFCEEGSHEATTPRYAVVLPSAAATWHWWMVG